MTFTKHLTAATENYAAQTKNAYIVPRNGKFMVTIMQTNSNGLDCQWFADDAAKVEAELVEAGYQKVGA